MQGKKIVTLWFDIETYERIRQQAFDERTSVSAWVRRAAEEKIANPPKK